MKMFGRRSFLRALGTAPLAGRAAAEAVAKELGHISTITGQGPAPSSLRDVVSGSTGSALNRVGEQSVNFWLPGARRKAMGFILADKARDAEIRAILSRQHKRISQIDPDIGGKMSWSLAAKVAYQRQRFVDEEMTEIFTEVSPWQAGRNWVEDQLKNFLLR